MAMGGSDATRDGGGQGAAGRSGPGGREWARMVVDARGVVTEWSASAERLLGYPAHHVVGRPVAELLVAAQDADGDVVLRHFEGRPVGCRVRVRPETCDPAMPRWAVALASAGQAGQEGQGVTEEVGQAFLEALFTLSPLGLYMMDPQLRIMRFNPAAEGIHGTPLQSAVGLRPTEAWPHFSGERLERVLEQVLRTGKPVIGFEKRGRPPGDPGREHVYSVSAFRLEDADGRILGVADAAVDVTDRHLAKERLALLAEAGTRIGTTLDVLRTAQELAEVLVPRLADSAAIDVMDPVLGGGEIPSARPEPGTVLRRAASGSRRTNREPGAYAVGEVSTFPATAPAAQVLADCVPRLVSPVTDGAAWVHGDPVRAGRILEEQVHSMMLVPLVAHDVVLGLVTCYRWAEQRSFDEEDLVLAQELAARTAVALDNARRYDRERNAVLTLQRGLLPQRLPVHSAVETAHHYAHSGAGGDWVDVIPLSGARVALVVGSVTGRGMRTAAGMGRLRAAVHTLADLDLEPDEVLARLDDVVLRLADEGDGAEPAGLTGATCLYLIYDPLSRRCTAAAAGRPGLVVSRPDGSVDLVDLRGCEPLGRPGPPFETAELDLPEGSVLTLHTGGLLQARPEAAGRAELERLLAGPAGSPRDICLALAEELLPADPRGDAAVLVARTHVLATDQVASWDLPADPAVVGTARSLAARQLTCWGMDEEVFATEVIVSELVTNAIRYGNPPVRLQLLRDRSLTCEVSDGSGAAPHLRHARTTDEGGRGLLLVTQLAERWGTRYTAAGKTIWAEQLVTAPAREPAGAGR